MSSHDPIIRSILSRFVQKESERPRHSRAVVVLEVSLAALAEPLSEANFIVIAGDGLSDFERLVSAPPSQ